MGDIVARTLSDLYALAEATYKQRVTALADYPLDPNSEWGQTPEGYRAAFLAGARAPWPGPRAAPELAARWKSLRRTRASGQMKPRPEVDHRHRSQIPRASNTGRAFGGSAWESSSNWSGAILTARDGERFSAVTGRWTVPDARASESATPPIPGPDAAPPSRRCSVWIGLDGHRLISRSLPQIGTTTAEIFENGQRRVEAYAWAQWWVRGEQFGEMQFEGFKVSPGQDVTCWLALHDENRAVLCIRNERTGAEDGVLWRSGPAEAGAPPNAAMQVHPEAAPVAGMAAVWIVERPAVMFREDLYPLPDFDRVDFTGCIAGVRAPGQPFEEVADLRALDGRRLVRMFEQRAAPWRAPRISVPDPPGKDRTALAVRYQG
jgi:hypothetical protein